MDIFLARHSLLNGISGTEGLSFSSCDFFLLNSLRGGLKFIHGRTFD